MALIVITIIVASIISYSEMYSISTEGDTTLEAEVPTYNYTFVTREAWGARKPIKTIVLTTPVPYVVIHHSYSPKACNKMEECCEAMRSMQNFHMDERHWWDIGYNFGVSSEGNVYEGRGWQTLGAHSLHFNTVSIGICVIGDWSTTLPPKEQLKATKSLIAAGISRGYIQKKYKLLGHRQVRDTECPGDALYQEITNWEHYSDFPASADDLLYVEELAPFRVVSDKGT